MRDPKLLPKVGDVLWKGTVSNRIFRRVIWRGYSPQVVRCIEGRREGDWTKEVSPNLRQWKKWASEAVIKSVAEQSAGGAE